MLINATSRVKRLFALLCLALAVVYAGSSATQISNTIQHSAAQASEHEHSMLSDALAIQAGHHADDDPADEVRPDKPCEIEPYEHLDQDWETRRD